MNMSSYSCCTPSSYESKQVSSLSAILKIVSEESRLKILCILRQGEHCVCDMIEHVNLSQSLISHHLRDLKDAGIVISDKRGLRVWYSLADKGRYITDLLFQISGKAVYTKSFGEPKETAKTMKIQVLGSGCPTCKNLYELTKNAVEQLGLKEEVEYLVGQIGIQKIIELGSMSSPLLVVDGEIAMTGFTPDIENIKQKIQAYIKGK
jgi:ArsR family transcriptional regulator